MSKVEKLSTVPSAFSAIAEKVNEVIDANPPLKAGRFIKITTSNENVLISSDITAEQVDFLLQQVQPRTFYVTARTGTEANVSAGAINNVAYAAATITSLSNGDKIYIDATVDAAGTVTAVTVSKAASVPSNTSTHAYTLLANVTVTSGQAAVSRVAWNYSQVQKCGTGTTYYWGGFGS